MKKVRTLITLGSLLENKYAGSQSLQEIIGNAAGYGEKSPNGIMDFQSLLNADANQFGDSSLNLTVQLDSGMLGGYNITVSAPSVDPAQSAPKYAKLPEQVKKYLEKHANSFQLLPDTYTLSYKGVATNKPNQYATNQ